MTKQSVQKAAVKRGAKVNRRKKDQALNCRMLFATSIVAVSVTLLITLLPTSSQPDESFRAVSQQDTTGSDCCSCCLGDVESQYDVAKVLTRGSENYVLLLTPKTHHMNMSAVLRVGFTSNLVESLTAVEAVQLWESQSHHICNNKSVTFMSRVFKEIIRYENETKKSKLVYTMTPEAVALEHRDRLRATSIQKQLAFAVPLDIASAHCALGKDLSVTFDVANQWKGSLQEHNFSHEEELIGFALGLTHDQSVFCKENHNQVKSDFHPGNFLVNETPTFEVAWIDFHGFPTKDRVEGDGSALNLISRYIKAQRSRDSIQRWEFDSTSFWRAFEVINQTFTERKKTNLCSLFSTAYVNMNTHASRVMTRSKAANSFLERVLHRSESVEQRSNRVQAIVMKHNAAVESLNAARKKHRAEIKRLKTEHHASILALNIILKKKDAILKKHRAEIHSLKTEHHASILALNIILKELQSVTIEENHATIKRLETTIAAQQAKEDL